MELFFMLYAGALVAALTGAGLWLAFLLFLALYSRRPEPAPPAPERLPSFLILVPAHNEEALIADTVKRILAIQYPRELTGLWVIADNCTDSTAEKARQAGANCLERNDTIRRGKGHALDYALHSLAGEAGDAVLFLDADSRPEPDYLYVLACCYGRGDMVVQGCYETWSTRETWFTRLTAMSFALRNRRVYPALHKLGWPVPLRGSGMLFRRNLIERIGWSTHGLTEDLEMTLLLLRQNMRITFAPDARSGQYMPPLPSEAGRQRQRWSAGERSFRREMFVNVIPHALKSGQWGRALSFLYMSAPGLSAQLFFLVSITVAALPVGIPLAVCGLALLLANGLYILSAAPAIDAGSLAALGMIPVYAAWRGLQSLAALLSGRGGAWQRTERPGETDGKNGNKG